VLYQKILLELDWTVDAFGHFVVGDEVLPHTCFTGLNTAAVERDGFVCRSVEWDNTNLTFGHSS
jgi:hypothetical protein